MEICTCTLLSFLKNIFTMTWLSTVLFFYYSLHLTFFVMFEKSKFLREYHLLSCLLFKNIKVSKTNLKKIYQKIELVN